MDMEDFDVFLEKVKARSLSSHRGPAGKNSHLLHFYDISYTHLTVALVFLGFLP